MEKIGNKVIIREYLYKYLVQKFPQKKIEGRPLSYLNKEDIKLLKTEKDKFYREINKLYFADKKTKDKDEELLFIYPKRIIKTRDKLPEPPDSSEELKSSLYSEEEILFNDFCDVNFTPKEYSLFHLDDEIILKDDLIYHSDTNKIILEKISNIMKVSFDEIFAMYKTKNNNLYPIGFNYNQSLIDKKNNPFNHFEKNLSLKKFNENLSDESFVNDIGIPINNEFINKFDHLFGNNYHINHGENKSILFFTLTDLINTFKFSGDEEDITNKKMFWGIVNKYFPLIKDINIMLKYDSFNSERREMINHTSQYINKLKIQNNKIYKIYSENVKENKIEHCTNFKTEFLKISNGDINEMNNNINIIKLFCLLECDENIHYMKLALGKNSSTSYKLNKDKICYLNSQNNLVTQQLLDNWIKARILNTENHYLYLFLENNLSIKLHIPELSCYNLRDKYVTLVINMNGRIEVLIDCYISKDDIKIIVEKCNEIITKINVNNNYSEDNIPIKLLNNQFLNNLSKTQLDYLECEFLISLSKTGDKIIPLNTKELAKIISYFDNIFRIQDITKSELKLRYKCEDNYNSQQNIRTVITSLKNPDNRKLSDDKIINEIQEYFCLTKDISQKCYDEWVEYFTRKRDSGQNIFLSKVTEVGPRISITQNGSYISVSLKDISSYRQFEHLIYIIETIVFIYKSKDGKGKSYFDIKTPCSQAIVNLSERVTSISDDSNDSNDSEVSEEELNSDDDEPEPEKTIIPSPTPEPEKVDKYDDSDDSDEEVSVDSDEEVSVDDEPESLPKNTPDFSPKSEPDSSDLDLPHLDKDVDLDSEEEEDEEEEDEEEGEEGDDDDDDDGDISDEFDVDQLMGGAKGDKLPKKYLANKLKEFNDEVFGVGYTRRCPNNSFLQPVILTESELKRIITNTEISGPRSFTNIIRADNVPNMGSPEKQKFDGQNLYFISPKFFDIKSRESIKEYIIYNSFIKDIYDIKPQESEKNLKEKISNRYLFNPILSEIILNDYKNYFKVSALIEEGSDEETIKDYIKKECIFYKLHNSSDGKQKNYVKKVIPPDDENIKELLDNTIESYSKTPLSKSINYDNKVFRNLLEPNEHESILERINTGQSWDEFTTQKNMFVKIQEAKNKHKYNAICTGVNKDSKSWKWNKSIDYFNPDPPLLKTPSLKPLSSKRSNPMDSYKSHLGEYIKHVNKLTPDGDLVFPLSILKKGVIPPELDILFNQDNKIVEKKGTGFLRVGIPHNIIPSFIASVYYSINGTGTSDELIVFFKEIKEYISSSLKNFLFLASGKLSRKVLPQRKIIDQDINDFKEFYNSQNGQIKEISSLEITDEEFISIEKFYENEEPTKIFIFNLFLARNNYLSYLNSDEEMDDYFLLPLLENKFNRKIIVFDDLNNDIVIKEQIHQNTIDDDDQVSFIFRKKIDTRIFYEPIVFFNKINSIDFNILHELNESLKFYDKHHDKKFYKKINSDLENYNISIPDSEIKYFYVNSHHEITYIITNTGFIIPYNSPLLEDYLKRMIFNFKPFIMKSLNDYKQIDGLGKLIGLNVSEEIIKNIVYKKDNTIFYIPVISEEYNKNLPEYKKYRIFSSYDLNELDNKILLDHNHTNEEYQLIIDDKKNEVEFHRIFYYHLKNTSYEDDYLIDSLSGALQLKKYKRYKFYIINRKEDHEYFGKFIKKYDNILSYDVIGFINDIERGVLWEGDPNPESIYNITLSIRLLDNIIMILQKIKTISDIRIELREYLMKYVNIDSLNSFSEEQKKRYLHKFIDLILVYKDNDLQGFSDILQSSILLKDIYKCSKENEIIFSSQEYHNGFLNAEFSKTSRFVQNYYNNELDTKPLKKYITNIPNFINKKYPGCLLEVLFENNEIRNIARLLMIDEQEIIKILIERYKLVFDKDNISSVNKIKKYNSSEISNEELLDSIQKTQYELSPIDLTFISEKLGITIYLYSAKYSKNNKYEELIFNDDNEKQILLYHYKEDFDKKITHKLGFITK